MCGYLENYKIVKIAFRLYNSDTDILKNEKNLHRFCLI
jgi:hypothetical protein